MKIILSAVVLSACAVSLFAQAPAVKTAAQAAGTAAPAPAKSKAQPVQTAAAQTPAAQDAAADKKAAAKPQKTKQAEADADDGTVMIDSKADLEDSGRYSSQGEAVQTERGETDVRGGIPASYGQCKGVITEGGRTILVFESSEDGTIYFVHVVIGKNAVSWKLVDHIGRSGASASSE